MATAAIGVGAMNTTTQNHLIGACYNGDMMMVKQIIDENINYIHSRCPVEYTPLIYSILGKHDRITKFLVDKGAYVNAKGKDGLTALMYSVVTDNPARTAFLLDRGADISATDKDGRTSLMYASSFKCPRSVGLLLLRGAEIDAVGPHNMTALMYASMYCRPENVRILLDSNARKDILDVLGDTALMHACDSDDSRANPQMEDVLDLLAENIDSVIDRQGHTRLTRAIAKNNLDAVIDYLERGASKFIRDRNGNTPMNLASMIGNAAIIDALNFDYTSHGRSSSKGD